MTSRVKGFYKLTVEERLERLAKETGIPLEELAVFQSPRTTRGKASGLTTTQADHMVENAVGIYSLPLGVGLNFIINGREVIVPMAIEEPSVIAGVSFMARLARNGGGFHASTSEPHMIGQLQLLGITDLQKAQLIILKNKTALLAKVDEVDPILKTIGGGARDLEVHVHEKSPIGPFLAVHLIYDVRDAMGANAVNTACEKLAPHIEEITGGIVRLRILTNLADRRLAKARCCIPFKELAYDEFLGEHVRDGIIDAWAFASVDPYRAATHNKGIMNGVDAVVIATGNDWRAIEAGAHAYAARSGRYTTLSTWGKDEKGNLIGELEMPMAVGIVGGTIKVHPAAGTVLKIMGVKTARELAGIIASVGLAQNLAALRALATEGIQRGHMSLHARQVAIAAGAEGDQIEKIAGQMVRDKVVRIDRAKELIKRYTEKDL